MGQLGVQVWTNSGLISRWKKTDMGNSLLPIMNVIVLEGILIRWVRVKEVAF